MVAFESGQAFAFLWSGGLCVGVGVGVGVGLT